MSAKITPSLSATGKPSEKLPREMEAKAEIFTAVENLLATFSSLGEIVPDALYVFSAYCYAAATMGCIGRVEWAVGKLLADQEARRFMCICLPSIWRDQFRAAAQVVEPMDSKKTGSPEESCTRRHTSLSDCQSRANSQERPGCGAGAAELLAENGARSGCEASHPPLDIPKGNSLRPSDKIEEMEMWAPQTWLGHDPGVPRPSGSADSLRICYYLRIRILVQRIYDAAYEYRMASQSESRP